MDLNKDVYKNINSGRSNIAQKEEPLSEEIVEEFKNYLETLEKKIEERYGRVRLQERLNVERIKKTLSEMNKCIAEGSIKITENKTKKYIHVNKVRYNTEPSGEDALSSLKIAISDKLKAPWLRRVNLFDFPFQVSLRELDNKKCIEMTHTFYNFKYTAVVRMLIREIIF
ncbi:MAG: hypothetical protein NTX65_17850 [Ignavibacteriales bacterium]|nr:hypothetical protein [Ignavibacteriales bacterium]